MIKVIWKYIVPILLLAPLYAMLSTTAYWAFLSYFKPPAQIKIIDYTTNVLNSDRDLFITYKSTWNRRCIAHISRTLISRNAVYSFGYNERVHDPGTSIVTVDINIPQNIPDGQYDLILNIQPVCNFYDNIFRSNLKLKPVKLTIDNNPIILDDQNTKPIIVHRHQRLAITTTFFRRRVCDSVLDMYLTDQKQNVILKGKKITLRPTDLDKQTIKGMFVIEAKPGKYLLHKEITSICDDKTYLAAFSPIPITVKRR